MVGSLAVLFASWDVKRFTSPGWRVFFLVSAVLISISTVFLKQHSALDILVALVVCIVAYLVVYRIPASSGAPLRSRRKRPEQTPEL